MSPFLTAYFSSELLSRGRPWRRLCSRCISLLPCWVSTPHSKWVCFTFPACKHYPFRTLGSTNTRWLCVKYLGQDHTTFCYWIELKFMILSCLLPKSMNIKKTRTQTSTVIGTLVKCRHLQSYNNAVWLLHHSISSDDFFPWFTEKTTNLETCLSARLFWKLMNGLLWSPNSQQVVDQLLFFCTRRAVWQAWTKSGLVYIS